MSLHCRFFTFYLILVDATDSGSGNLEIAVSINDKNIPNYVQNEGGARFRVKFTPDQSGMYHIQIKFNGIDIHGKSPVSINSKLEEEKKRKGFLVLTAYWQRNAL